MPFGLLKYGFQRGHPAPRAIPPATQLKSSYDVVVIGGGGHGLATAYYLAKDHGITNVAVLEQGYLGGGNTGRNTAIVRSNYLTPEGVRFYEESLSLFARLSQELDFNMLFSRRGHFTLAHTDSAIRTMRWRAEVNQHLGVNSQLVDRAYLKKAIPLLNLSEDVRYPVLGALYHPPGAILRHDAVAWGYAARAAERGVALHQKTRVMDILCENGRVSGVVTDRGVIKCGMALQAVAGSSSLLARMAGFKLPIHTVPLQACVSQPLKRVLDPIIVSGSLHTYISQSDRGELVMGGAVDPYPLYSNRSTLDFKEQLIAHILELFPCFAQVKLMRQWTGMSDMTPDFSPIMGKTPLDNYYIDAGWGTWGFKATPVCGKRLAELIATGSTPEVLQSFTLDRFERFDLLGEKGAASVGH